MCCSSLLTNISILEKCLERKRLMKNDMKTLKTEKKIKTEPVPYYYRVLGVSKNATSEEIKDPDKRAEYDQRDRK